MLHGVELHYTATKTEYLYDNCNDEVLESLQAELAILKTKVENRQKFLKALSEPTNIITDNGESTTINPPVKRQWHGVKTSFK